jgi:uncharacterized membrane protein (UPF0127 family)
VRPAVALPALLLTAGCSTPAQPPPAEAAQDDRVRAVLGGVELRLEVADEPSERAFGLMQRESVPPGTGMLFRYDAPVQTSFTMYDVPVPLTAVFVRDGRVVFSVVMPPCGLAVPQDCPTYGPDEPFDTVVETAPETLPDVRPGDRLVVRALTPGLTPGADAPGATPEPDAQA